MRDRVQRLIEAFVTDDLDSCASLTSERWANPVDRPTEASPQAHWKSLGADIRRSLGDWKLDLDDVVDAAGELTARLRGSAIFTEDLWSYPATGKRVSFEAKLVARPDGERLLWWLEDWTPILTLRDLGLVPPPEFMDRPLAYPVQLPDAVLKWAFNGGFFEKPCSHLDQIRVTDAESRGCAACDAEGTVYPAARMCLTCGHIGCCDTATNKHARKHFEETGHPLMRSLRLDESWVWCYVDQTVMSAKW